VVVGGVVVGGGVVVVVVGAAVVVVVGGVVAEGAVVVVAGFVVAGACDVEDVEVRGEAVIAGSEARVVVGARVVVVSGLTVDVEVPPSSESSDPFGEAASADVVGETGSVVLVVSVGLTDRVVVGESTAASCCVAGAGRINSSFTTETPVHATAMAAALPRSHNTTNPEVLSTTLL
jgi:hypothetical protein